MIAADDAWLVTLGGDGIDSETETLIKLAGRGTSTAATCRDATIVLRDDGAAD